jgi:hypothetical protein
MRILVIGSGGEEKISRSQLKEIAAGFGNFAKAVVDIEKGIMAVGGELHADEEALLLEKGSQQRNLWGINLYPELQGEEFIEFDSVINLRPMQGNRTRGVDEVSLRQKIKEIVCRLILP